MCQDDEQWNIPPSATEQDGGPTADEIGEQVMRSYFATTWGARPTNAASLELNEYERLHRSPHTMYVGGLVKIADITEALVTSPEQVRQQLHAKIPAEVLRRSDEVRELAVKVLGSPREAKHWLERPLKIALEGRRPAEVLRTLEGCDKVEQLLKNLYS